MQRLVLFACLLSVAGCIERKTSVNDEAQMTDAASNDGSLFGQTDGGAMASDGSAKPDGMVDSESDGSLGTGGTVGDASVVEPPPPPANADPCERFCARTEMCLFPACSGLEDIAGDEFCFEYCENTPETWLDETSDLSCGEFVERLYSFSRELAEFCSDEPAPDECGQICEFASGCGFAGDGCARLCRNLAQEQRNCMLRADRCETFFACVEDEPRMPPDRGDLCEPYCFRRSQCVFNACAPGTLPDDFFDECLDSCIDTPPTLQEYQRFFDSPCEAVVEGVREDNPAIDARCDADPQAACENLCADTIVPCMNIAQAECVNACEGWDRANQLCIITSESCEDVTRCYGDRENQDLCRQSCDHLQFCLEEACPPRIIPPRYTDNCTADCLGSPRNEADTQRFLDAPCRQVRELIYRDNQELRPLCEGNADFRPTAEECSAFCDQTLLRCLDFGGRNFCTAACASLDREQYQCALENQMNCDAINACIGD